MEEHHRQQTIEYIQLENLSAFNISQLSYHQQKRRALLRDICPDLKGNAQL